MLAADARSLLLKLTAAFPSSGVGDDTVVLWLGYVGRVPVEVGQPAVSSLIETCERFPTVAQWQEACRLFRGPGRALPSPSSCAICEGGFLYADDGETVLSMWIENRFEPGGAHIKVPRPCPNGCRPGRIGCP